MGNRYKKKKLENNYLDNWVINRYIEDNNGYCTYRKKKKKKRECIHNFYGQDIMEKTLKNKRLLPVDMQLMKNLKK
jgi:hypothetical protein